MKDPKDKDQAATNADSSSEEQTGNVAGEDVQTPSPEKEEVEDEGGDD